MGVGLGGRGEVGREGGGIGVAGNGRGLVGGAGRSVVTGFLLVILNCLAYNQHTRRACHQLDDRTSEHVIQSDSRTSGRVIQSDNRSIIV